MPDPSSFVPGEFMPSGFMWPIALLKAAAGVPLAGIWLAPGATVVVPDMVNAGLGFTAALVTTPVSLPAGPWKAGEDGETSMLHALVPIYPEERAFLREYGSGKLQELLTAAGVTDVVDYTRPNVCRASV
jgi:hypothetical protein